MKRLSWKRVLVAACGMSILGGAAVVSLPQVAHAAAPDAHTVYLWDGTGATDTNVVVRGWGNGSAKVKNPVDYPSRSALVVTTHNLYEGARFVFAKPVDLAPYRNGGVLRLRLRSEKLTATGGPRNSFSGSPNVGGFSNPSGTPGFNPMSPGSSSDGSNPGFNPGGVPFPQPTPGGTFGGAPGATSDYNPYPTAMQTPMPDPSLNVPPISKIQVVMHLENGALFGLLDYGSSTEFSVRPDQFGWQSFALPIQSLRATPGASGALRSVVLTGDNDHTFMIGQLALAPAGSLSVSIRQAMDAPGTQQTAITIASGASLRLIADVESGSTDSEVEWNFDADKSGSLPLSKPEQALSVTTRGSGRERFGRGAPGMPDGPPNSDIANNPYNPTGGYQGGPPQGGYPSSSIMPGGIPGMPGGAPISIDLPRMDARGLIAQFTYPNEEQDYRVEVTVRDRLTRSELGKASLIVRVRSDS